MRRRAGPLSRTSAIGIEKGLGFRSRWFVVSGSGSWVSAVRGPWIGLLGGPSAARRTRAPMAISQEKLARNRQNACPRPPMAALSCVRAKNRPKRKKAPKIARADMRFGHARARFRRFGHASAAAATNRTSSRTPGGGQTAREFVRATDDNSVRTAPSKGQVVRLHRRIPCPPGRASPGLRSIPFSMRLLVGRKRAEPSRARWIIVSVFVAE
jgi:hypothetical protein